MTYHLVSSIDELTKLLDYTQEEYGLDTETTGLNTRICDLVGISFAWAPDEAAYVPVGHKLGDNLPLKLVTEVFRRHDELHKRKAIFWNAKYDRNVLQRNTGWIPTRFEDAIELVYLENPDRKEKSLKIVSKEELGVEMEKFMDLFSPEEIKSGALNIANKLPSRCRNYACADADYTLQIYKRKATVREYNDFHVKIDTKLVDIVRKMEHNGGLLINRQYVQEQVDTLTARGEALKEQIFRQLGTSFELRSPKQLGIALFERGAIPSPGMTKGKSPIHKTDAETLEKMTKQFPVIELIISYKKCQKALDSYFRKLLDLDDLQIPVRFNFYMYGAPTFRFSAPGGNPLKDGACGINIQAVSNGEARDVFGVDLKSLTREDKEKDYLSDVEDEEMLFERDVVEMEDEIWASTNKITDLPWILHQQDDDQHLICLREICKACPAGCQSKGVDTTRRIQKGAKMIPSVRQAFRAPDGWTMLSFDYDRQELVIGANMSQEPRWLQALQRGEDLHASTASAAFGVPITDFLKMPKEEQKQKRSIGKTLNFATFYGATAYTLANKADISTNQAEILFNSFVANHPVLFSWMNKVHVSSRKLGYTSTYFGRRRSLKHLYDRPERHWQQFADRSAVNTAVQGTAAEITRIAMVKVNRAIEDAGLQKSIKMVMTLHDELSFLVKDGYLEQAYVLIKKNMEFNVKSWQVQLSVSGKVGAVWGAQKNWEPGLKLAA